MRLAELVDVSNAVANVAGRLDKTARLADLLRRLAPDEVEPALGFLTGSPRQGRLGIGHAVLSAARGTPPSSSSTLELRDVDATFDGLAGLSGKGVGAERARRLRDLLSRATTDEQDFLVRLLYGELRQGAVEGVLTDAIARAADVPAARVRRAAMMSGRLGEVARAALHEGPAALDRFLVQLFRPVQPMLAEPADDAAAAVSEMGEAALEFKVDGARIQVHRQDDEVRIYTRNLREVTSAAPEVVEVVRALPARSLILDGEVIALRPDGSPRPFQETMSRFGRKLDVEALRAAVPLTPFFFDLLHVDGGDLVDDPQSARFGALSSLAPPALIVPHVVTASPEEAEGFLERALAMGHEGIMAKARGSPYAAGSRGQSWLKVKRARTLDLVVLAAEWGHGRRRGWLSNLHLGARDPATNGFVMLGKTFKGLTDERLAWQTKRLQELEVGRDEYTVYVRPELVVEIAFSDLQKSPHYPGGLALRFARVKRYREDKRAKDADTIQTVRQAAGLVD